VGVSLITGVAGFIGSTLADALLAQGESVRGVDCFTDYYARELKEANLVSARRSSRFEFMEADLATCPLNNILDGVDTVFHLAAQAGVRASWGDEFSVYVRNNILCAQRLLEAVRIQSAPPRFVYASSSSVYGDSPNLPQREADPCQPISPYGVSKLAAEHLCYLYWKNYGVPTVSLRLFTVYGPRQRPDMAFCRFFRAAQAGDPIVVYGDGEQTRDFTYVDDIVGGMVGASQSSASGEVLNLGGGSRTSVNQVLEWIGELTGGALRVERTSVQKGDVRDTLSDTARARDAFGFAPAVSLVEGLRRQWEWLRGRIASEA
jgi:UDP-glucose 4-epimerase